MNPSASTKREKILIIESNEKLGQTISDTLKKEGYVVYWSKTGDEGLKSIYDVLPHLIIIDLVLNQGDVYEILQKKKAEVMLSKIPVFILSTQGTPINMRLVPEGSVVDFVVSLEPDPVDLLARIDKYFNHAQAPTPPKAGAGKKVLWVEDDKLIGSILEKKFISSGFDLFHAVNGEEAMAHIKEVTPDIIVLDLMLPGMDGFEILQKIRMEERFKKIPALILSNLSKPSDIEKAKVLGASKFMVKASSSLDQIVSEVRDIASQG